MLAPIDINMVHREILDGLKHERLYLDKAREAVEVYENRFDRWDDYYDPDGRSTRNIPFMSRIVDSLAQTYKRGPIRSLPDFPQAEAWLNEVYEHCRINATWQAADRYSLAADVVAIEVCGTDDEHCPIGLQLWTADSFAVFCNPAGPTKPEAVVTIDVFDHQRRYRLITKDVIRVYQTPKLMPGQTSGGLTPTFVGEEPNPYGVLPFAFAHQRPPVVQWHNGGMSEILTQANEHLNWRLKRIADKIRYLAQPVLAYVGVDPTFEMPREPRPGEGIRIPGGTVDRRGEPIRPEIKYIHPPLEFVGQEWADIKQYWDCLLQTLGVPPSAIRLEQQGSASGIALVAEQLPLMLYAQARQEAFTYYEQDLAKVVLQVGAAHLTNNGRPVPFEAEAANTLITVKWDNEEIERLLRPDRDQQDQFLLDNGLISRVEIIKRRFGMTEEEARAYLEMVAEQKEFEATLAIEAKPEPAEVPEQQEDDQTQEDMIDE